LEELNYKVADCTVSSK